MMCDNTVPLFGPSLRVTLLGFAVAAVATALFVCMP
jgi:hypothetical protein